MIVYLDKLAVLDSIGFISGFHQDSLFKNYIIDSALIDLFTDSQQTSLIGRDIPSKGLKSHTNPGNNQVSCFRTDRFDSLFYYFNHF